MSLLLRLRTGRALYPESLVATRLNVPSQDADSSKEMMAKSVHQATDVITSLRVFIQNFRISGGREFGTGSAMTVRAAVEYNGTFTRLHFSTAPDSSGHPGDDTYGLVPAVASGAAETTAVGVIGSDAASVNIPDGATFWVLVWAHNEGGFFNNGASTTGELLRYGATTTTDCTDGTTFTATTSASWQPIAIVARTTKVSVLGLGDSIMEGTGDANKDAATMRRGVLQRGLPTTTASLNLGGSGERAELLYTYSPGRRVVWPYASHVVLQPGINDLYAGKTAVEVLGYNQTLAGHLEAWQKVLLTTITPYTTGSWSTLVAQTAVDAGSNDVQRLAYNGTSLPAWAWDRLDFASVLADGTSTSKWVVAPSPPYTADGLHPNTAGNLLTKTFVTDNYASKFD